MNLTPLSLHQATALALFFQDTCVAVSINHRLCSLSFCDFLGPEQSLQGFHNPEANKCLQPGDTMIHALVISHAGSEFELLIVVLIVYCKAVIALMGFAQAFIRTAPVLFEEVALITAPALPEQIDPAFANIETEDVEAPAQLRVSVEAPALSVFVVDVGMPILPVTARDHFGKYIEQEDKDVTQRLLEFQLTETAQDVHDRRRDFKDDHVVARVSLTDE